jgi:hypothetical protein
MGRMHGREIPGQVIGLEAVSAAAMFEINLGELFDDPLVGLELRPVRELSRNWRRRCPYTSDGGS